MNMKKERIDFVVHFIITIIDPIGKGNYFKLKEGGLKLDIRKIFFTVRLVKHWNRLPRGVVDNPVVGVFKARLEGALSNLV